MFLVESFHGGEQPLVNPRYDCSAHCLVSFSVDKTVASVVDPAKSTLGDADDDTDSDRSAKGCLRKFARRLELPWEHRRKSNGSLFLLEIGNSQLAPHRRRSYTT